MGEESQSRKGDDEKDTEGKHNSLSSRHADLLVLFRVAPVCKIERFRSKLDLSLFVVGSIDDIVNEVTVSLLKLSIQFVHVLGHH